MKRNGSESVDTFVTVAIYNANLLFKKMLLIA